MFEGTIRVGHSLDLKALGEGAETEAQLDFLRQTACCEAQGYIIARPMDAAVASNYLARHVLRTDHAGGSR
ncbi:MAG: hypothetical protein ACRER2_02635 [Methylococcales bacterium]